MAADMMRIWYQSAVEMRGASPYREALEKHFQRVADPGTEVALFGVDPGTWAAGSPHSCSATP